MRGFLFTAVLLASTLAAALTAPALALQLDDTMSAWGQSSEQERTELLKQLFGDAPKVGLRRCMDETAKTPGHTALAIGGVAKVCATAAGKAEQPV